MTLNQYRDEAGDFLKRIGAANEGMNKKIEWLEEEFNGLKAAKDEPARLSHQIYDMLFLLFEIAAVSNSDLDGEWAEGMIRKEKYIPAP
jgi:hypothetical protein